MSALSVFCSLLFVIPAFAGRSNKAIDSGGLIIEETLKMVDGIRIENVDPSVFTEEILDLERVLRGGHDLILTSACTVYILNSKNEWAGYWLTGHTKLNVFGEITKLVFEPVAERSGKYKELKRDEFIDWCAKGHVALDKAGNSLIKPKEGKTLSLKYYRERFGIKIRNFDANKLEGLDLNIKKEGRNKKLLIQYGKTPLYVSNGGQWKESKMTGEWKETSTIGEMDKQRSFYFKLDSPDDGPHGTWLELTKEEFAKLCKLGKVALDEEHTHLLMPKEKKKSGARLDVFGDDYNERLSLLMSMVKRLEKRHQ